MPDTPRFALPLLEAGQAQKEVTHNEALLALDRLLHVRVETRGLGVPPAGVAPGVAYLVPAGASGAWAGQADSIASHDGFGWNFAAPVPGVVAYVADEAVFVHFDGAWSDGAWPAAGLRVGGRTLLAALPATIAEPVGGTLVDTECRNVVSAMIGALRAQGVIA
ncbi:hypothetical protein IP88_16280 [alpha proteobacterium AAP81b]|nr:hypothetical protein IP88_16280 [alpha proteobacterium AAP81b]